ncbi:MAG: long-chain fatty acid--CoA ligase [Betaproteobacteria bacterium RIFCSPLOWO2_12_FULL_68_20]|nr:MAG: long-chain fatty acid--CoA ligase [Betaproteobacteria bacterium RIFCSPLOWO2_12_FULL_68_20]
MFTRHYAHWPPGRPKSLPAATAGVYANLAHAAARFPDRVAIDYYGSTLSYLELRRQADALAGFLQGRCGVARGDRVILLTQNSPHFVIGYYAILRADAVAVPLNPMYRSEELRTYAEDCGANAIVATQELWDRIEPLARAGVLAQAVIGAYSDHLHAPTGLPMPDFVHAPRRTPAHPAVADWRDAVAAGLAPAEHRAGLEDLAVMPYTSGTTGRPKGCMHTHATVQATAAAYLRWRGAPEHSVVLAALPFFHVTGMQTGMNGPIHAAATLVILSRWDRDCAAMQIERAKVTNWTAITTMLVDFVSNPELAKHDLSSLQVLGGGGAAMPEAVAKRLEETIGLPYVEGYGLTETMAPSHMNPPQRPKPQCGGVPIFDTDARVLDLDTGRECGPGEVGEIVVRGPQVFKGYWNQPEETARAFLEHDGHRFLRTGDLGYYDEEGYFFITDRLKRMINAAGFKVWPAEVEAMLYAHPDVQEACVIGTPDAYRGESVKALIVLKQQARGRTKPEEIVDWARGRMAAFKVPRTVEFVEELPKTATGKILWRSLQDEENRKRGAA